VDCGICDCVYYRPVTAPDPLLHDQAHNASKLLTFAKESKSAKCRRLGVRIEEMLTNLAALSEKEIAEKAAAERRAAEMDKAKQAMNKAQDELDKAMAKIAELGGGKRPTRKETIYTKTYPCDICGQSFKNVGVHKHKAHYRYVTP